MNDDDKALQVARTGDSLERFLGSNAGRYLWKKADKYEEEAKCGLVDVSPRDVEAITELQNKALVAELFRSWVIEGIQSGDVALQHLETVEA